MRVPLERSWTIWLTPEKKEGESDRMFMCEMQGAFADQVQQVTATMALSGLFRPGNRGIK